VPLQAAAYTDFSALARLRGAASRSDPAALREAAGQFEALLVQSMLKSMRDTRFGKGLFDNSTTDMYRDLLDRQLSLDLARGKGLGLADMIVRQLGGGTAAPAATPQRVALSARVGDTVSALAGSAADFVRELWPHAQAAARRLGVSAQALLAQSALETGWGRHVPSRADGTPSFNLFGLKAGSAWRGDSVSVPTLEFEAGTLRREHARFRAYDSIAASFDDYAALISGDERYAGALARGDDIAGFARALQDAGYATDPAYARKLEEIARGEQMRSALEGLSR
jgi:flagellar protein FlgJ